MTEPKKEWWQIAWETALEQSGLSDAELRDLERDAGGGVQLIADILERGGNVGEELRAIIADRQARVAECFEQSVRWKSRAALERGPAALMDLPLDQLRGLANPRLLRVLDEWTYDSGGILVTGPTGVGKTTGAAALVPRLMRAWLEMLRAAWSKRNPTTDWGGTEEDGPIVWARAYDLATARPQHGLGKGEPEIIDRAKTADVLILDDLGQEDRDGGVIFHVLNDRYDASRPSIVTTGLTQDELVQRYKAHGVRRIIECGGKRGKLVDLFPATKLRSVSP